MLEAINLGCVRGERRLFSNMSFSLEPGTFLKLTGSNGSGKTSLLRILCGLMPPAEGEVRWRGASIRSLREEYCSLVIYIGHAPGIKNELSAIENLRILAGLSGVELDAEQAANALAQIGLAGNETLPAAVLSQGQRRRLALARLIVCKTALWVLDEVLTSLDAAAATLVTSMIGDHLGRGGIAIVATHQDFSVSAGSFQRIELAS